MVGQPEILAELRRIRDQLEGGAAPTQSLIARYDQLIGQAAHDGPAETPDEAIACLKLALHAMGAAKESLRPEERLIKHAIIFLKNTHIS